MSGGASREAGMERWLWEHAEDWLDGTPGSSTLDALAAVSEEDVPPDLLVYLGPALVFGGSGWPARAGLRISAAEIAHESALRASALGASRLLAGARIPHAFFKGADFRYRLYPEPHRRTSCDLDLLLPFDARSRAVEVLRESGASFREKPSAFLSGAYHELGLDLGGTALDLHTSLLQRGRTAFEAESVISGAESAKVEGGLLPVPSREDSLALALIHIGAHEGGAEFVDFRHGLDLALAFTRWRDLDWRRIAARARGWRCRRLAGAAIWTWRSALRDRIPQGLLDALDPGFLQRRAAVRTRKVLAFRKVAPSGRLRLSQLGRKFLFAEGLPERLWLLRELARRARVTPSIR